MKIFLKIYWTNYNNLEVISYTVRFPPIILFVIYHLAFLYNIFSLLLTTRSRFRMYSFLILHYTHTFYFFNNHEIIFFSTQLFDQDFTSKICFSLFSSIWFTNVCTTWHLKLLVEDLVTWNYVNRCNKINYVLIFSMNSYKI